MLENEIPFNIWDDYYDDGIGKLQKTHGYVEEYDVWSDEEKEEIAKVIFEYLQTLDLTGVEVKLAGEDVNFKNLSHERREKLVEELEKSGLKYKEVPIYFYSES